MTEVADEVALPDVETLVRRVARPRDARMRRVWREVDGRLSTLFRGVAVGPLRRRLAWPALRLVLRLSLWRGRSLASIERRLRDLLRRHGDPEVRAHHARERAARMSARVAPWVIGSRVVDVGGGNGLFAARLAEDLGVSVTVTDVLDYRLANVPLEIVSEGERMPYPDRHFDTSVIYLVLHHADDPERLLREAVRVTRRRVIIMEGEIDAPDRVWVNAFLDWFLNRIVQREDINLPFAYRTIRAWRETFERLGLTVNTVAKVGVDDPVAPEHHVFFVLDRF